MRKQKKKNTEKWRGKKREKGQSPFGLSFISDFPSYLFIFFLFFGTIIFRAVCILVICDADHDRVCWIVWARGTLKSIASLITIKCCMYASLFEFVRRGDTRAGCWEPSRFTANTVSPSKVHLPLFPLAVPSSS